MYKVVRNRYGILHSAFVSRINKLDIVYSVDKWVRPNVEGTKIFVFINLHDALEFIQNIQYTLQDGEKLEIYNCSVLNPVYEYDKFIRYLDDLEYITGITKSDDVIKEDMLRYHYTPIWNSIYADAIKLHDLIQ